MTLPSPSSAFGDRKAKILQQLAVPDADYTDASPKGSVDQAIRPLLEQVNATDGFVSTSSCAGRVSVFLEGRKATVSDSSAAVVADEAPVGERLAGVGGKGGGGTWLYVSHDPYTGTATGEDWIQEFSLDCPAQPTFHGAQSPDRRLIHFKFEPMILHILTASSEHAQLLLRCALQAGFRESGAVSLTPPSISGVSSGDAMPIVAVRSMGLSLESLVGYEDANGKRSLMVSPDYLDVLMQIANQRFVENTRRIDRFAAAFRDAIAEPVRKNDAGGDWEDAAARRDRMRAEGLRRQAELKAKLDAEAQAEVQQTEVTEAND